MSRAITWPSEIQARVDNGEDPRAVLVAVLNECNCHVRVLAQRLGVSYNTLEYWLLKYKVRIERRAI